MWPRRASTSDTDGSPDDITPSPLSRWWPPVSFHVSSASAQRQVTRRRQHRDLNQPQHPISPTGGVCGLACLVNGRIRAVAAGILRYGMGGATGRAASVAENRPRRGRQRQIVGERATITTTAKGGYGRPSGDLLTGGRSTAARAAPTRLSRHRSPHENPRRRVSTFVRHARSQARPQERRA